MRPGVGGLGGTYAGSPLGCAAGLAVLDVIREEKLLERAQQIGNFMVSRLKGLQARFPCIGDVRGLGAMVAIELVKNRRADSPDADLTKALVQAAGPARARDPGLRHVRERHPLPRAAHDLGCAAEGRLEPVRAGAWRMPCRLERSGKSAATRLRRRVERAGRAVYARPAFASVGVWKYSLSAASCSTSFLSSAMRPSAVLMGMQSWQRGSPQGWRE